MLRDASERAILMRGRARPCRPVLAGALVLACVLLGGRGWSERANRTSVDVTRTVGATSLDTASKYLYVASAFSPQISGFRIDAETGALTPVPGSPFMLPGVTAMPPSVSIARDPLGRFILANHASGTVWLLRINPETGGLSPSDSHDTGDYLPQAPAVDVSGRFLYAAGLRKSAVWGFSVGADAGSLRPLRWSPFPATGERGCGPDVVSIDGGLRRVYVTECGGTRVWGYAMDPATGVLRASPGSPWETSTPTTSAEYALVVHPSSRFAYVGAFGFAIDQETAALTPLRGSPFPVGVTHVHPNGRSAYLVEGRQLRVLSLDPESGQPKPGPGGTQAVGDGPHTLVFDGERRRAFLASATADTIAVFDVSGDDGFLRPVPGSPFRTGDHPAQVFLHPSGRFVYVANAYSNDVSGYRIDADTGSLSQCPGSPYRALDREAHRATTLAAARRFVYVAGSESNNVAAYRLDLERGELSMVPGSPFGAGKRPSGVAVDPRGRFLLVSNAGSDDVSAFAIDRETGGLAAVPGSPFKAGYAPSGVAIHPSGRFAYVTNYKSENISAYHVGADGTLARASRWPCAAGGHPTSISMHPTGRFAYASTSGIMSFAVDDTSGELRALSETPLGHGGTLMWAGVKLVVSDDHGTEFFSVDPATGELSSGQKHNQTGLVIDHAGRFAYASHLDGFGILQGGAALAPITPLDGSPEALAPHQMFQVRLVAIDPTDRYLIVATDQSQLVAYPRDQATGALTLRSYPADFVGGSLSPSAIAITP
jgi:6-phosphogluconolactonase (cycloisomerase 2 family)